MQIIILKNFFFIINLLFYNKPYIIERPIKCLKNIDPLLELPFYEQWFITKADQAFKGYAMSYKVEIIDKKFQFYN